MGLSTDLHTAWLDDVLQKLFVQEPTVLTVAFGVFGPNCCTNSFCSTSSSQTVFRVQVGREAHSELTFGVLLADELLSAVTSE